MEKKKQAEGVTVVLSCVYSGHPGNPGPGEKITVTADEAKRLIEIGAAVAASGK